jgi:hypothetical protein
MESLVLVARRVGMVGSIVMGETGEIALAAAPLRPVQVEQDLEQPRPDAARLSQLPPARQRLQQRILDQFVGIVGVAGKRACKPPQGRDLGPRLPLSDG